ncbi:MAG TPA: FAD:protein FMN transferase [Anaerolineae bacterium]
MQYDEFRAMNSHILVGADGESALVEAGFKEVRAFIAESEARFTRFSQDSELSQLNRTSGGWFIASEPLYEVVLQARRLMDLTCGLFDPSIIRALRRAGYDRSMDEIRTAGALPERSVDWPELVTTGFAAVEFKPEIRAIHLPRDVQIDLGGIAKGWIAEQAANVLAPYARGCAVSAGGDIYFNGLPDGENTWPVAFEDPRNPDQSPATLRVRGGGVVTSSITLRRWVQGQQERHHIIDPRTGEPAVTDWLSVTVAAPHTWVAEAFAKAILIAGSQQAQTIADRSHDIEFLGFKQDGSLWGSSHAKELLSVTGQLI